MKPNPTKEYLDRFPTEFANERDRRYLAFQVALDTRKFEIDLYWKRATYFGAFIALAFTGYFKLENHSNKFPAFLLACIGAFLTFAFLCLNRGSKYWQENWENHTAVLCDSTIGPLFSQILARPDDRPFLHKVIIGPAAISVSKINDCTSVYLLLVWSILILIASPERARISPCISSHPFLLTFAFNIFAAALMRLVSATSRGKHTPRAKPNETELSSAG